MRTILRAIAALALTVLASHLTPDVTGQTLAIGPIAIGAGLGGLFGGLFGGGGQSQTTNVDPATQAFIEQFLRPGGIRLSNAAVGIGAGIPGLDPSFGPESFRPFLNPFLEQVLGASNREFDEAEARARQAARIESTLSGTGRGSGAGVLEGTRLGEIDRARASASAGIFSQGFDRASGLALNRSQNDLNRLLASQGILAGSIGPHGTVTSSDNGAGTLERLLAGGASGALFGAGLQTPAGDPASGAASDFNVSQPRRPVPATFADPRLGPLAPPPDISLFRPPSLGSDFRFGDTRFGGTRFGGTRFEGR